PTQTTTAAPEPTTPPVSNPRERSAALQWNEALLTELGISFREDYNRAQSEYDAMLAQAPQLPQMTPEVEAARREATSLRAKALAFDALLPLLWLCGTAGAAMFMGIGGIRLRRKVKRTALACDMARYEALLSSCQDSLGIKRRVRIILQSHVGTPALLGVMRPEILLPEYAENMSDARLEYVILHELSHLKRGDGLVNALLLAIRAVYWFNPLVWLLLKFVREDMELANDAAVLKGMGQEERKEYSLSLVEVLMGCGKQRHTMLCMTDGKKNIERRIGMIQLGEFFKRRKWVIAVAGVLVIAGIAALFLTQGANGGRSESYNFDGAGVTVTMRLPKGMEIPEFLGVGGDQYYMAQKGIVKGEQGVAMLFVDPLEDISGLLRELPADVEDYREVWTSADGEEGSVTLLCNAGATRAVLAYNLTLNRYVQIEFDYDALTNREHTALAKSLRLKELPIEQRKGETRQFQHGDLSLEITKVAFVDLLFENEGTALERQISVFTLYPGATLTVINADNTLDAIDSAVAKWYIQNYPDGQGGENIKYIPLTDGMSPLIITHDMKDIYNYNEDYIVLMFSMYEEPQDALPPLSPTFLSPEQGLEAIKPLIWGSEGWWLDTQGDYIFAHFFRYLLRYDVKTNKIDKFIDLGDAPQSWWYAATYSPDGRYCVAQAQAFDAPGQTGRVLIDLKNETVKSTEQEHYPHSTQTLPYQVEPRLMEHGYGWFLNDVEIKALRPYAGTITEVIAMEGNRVGAMMPVSAEANGYLGYYKLAVIDLAQDKIVQECIMNVLDKGEEYPTYPDQPDEPEPLLIDYHLQSVTVLRARFPKDGRSSYDGFDIVKVIDAPAEVAGFEECLKRGAWEPADEGDWLKVEPSSPQADTLILYMLGEDGRGLALHLYDDLASEHPQGGAVSMAMYGTMPDSPEKYRDATDYTEFERYWVSWDTYKILYGLTV
ncbi:MAG: hypothetical protein FWC27_01555, partial [Firmicutes bacterium]|nr:hypothetical protein [Bacillota bacterium]